MNEYEKQDDLDQLVRRLRAAVNGATVTPDEFMSAMKSLVINFGKRFSAIFDLINAEKTSNKAEFSAVDAKIADIRSSLKTFEAALKTKKGKVELEQDLDDIWQQINHLVEIMPTQHDNSATEESIATINRKLKTLQTAYEKQSNRKLRLSDIADFEDYMSKVLAKLTSKKKIVGGPLMPIPDFGPFHESFAMDGVLTWVTLSRGVGAQGTAVMVRYNGQMLDLGNQYTVNGNKITLLFTPDNETTVSVTYWGG